MYIARRGQSIIKEEFLLALVIVMLSFNNTTFNLQLQI